MGAITRKSVDFAILRNQNFAHGFISKCHPSKSSSQWDLHWLIQNRIVNYSQANFDEKIKIFTNWWLTIRKKVSTMKPFREVGEPAQIFEGHDRWLQNLWIFREFLTIFPTLVSCNWSHPADSDRCCISNITDTDRYFVNLSPHYVYYVTNAHLMTYNKDDGDTHPLYANVFVLEQLGEEALWMYRYWSNWARRWRRPPWPPLPCCLLSGSA